MKKLFTNNIFFLVMFLITITCQFALLVLEAFSEGGNILTFDWLTTLILFACEITMFVSYNNHSKNLMKGMIGATLMAIVLSGLYSICTSTADVRFSICAGLYTLVAVLLFINHFSINAEHTSKPGKITANIILCILFAVIEILWLIFDIISGLPVFDSLICALFLIGNVVTIVCIEAKLDSYRINRETAGWTEEAGYPEGYVHEFEKEEIE